MPGDLVDVFTYIPLLALIAIAKCLTLLEVAQLCMVNRHVYSKRMQMFKHSRAIEYDHYRERYTRNYVGIIMYNNLGFDLLKEFIMSARTIYEKSNKNSADLVVEVACKHGFLEPLRNLLEGTDDGLDQWVLLRDSYNYHREKPWERYARKAIFYGKTNIVSYFLANDNAMAIIGIRGLLNLVFAYGNLDILKLVLDYINPDAECIQYICNYIYTKGINTFDMLDYIVKTFPSIKCRYLERIHDHITFTPSIRGVNDITLSYIIQAFDMGKKYADFALPHIIGTFPQSLRYIYNNCGITTHDITECIANCPSGYILPEVITFLFEDVGIDILRFIDTKLFERYLDSKIENADLDFVRSLFDNKYIQPSDTKRGAAIVKLACNNDQLDIIRYMFEEICLSFQDICAAMGMGQYEFLKDIFEDKLTDDNKHMFEYVCTKADINPKSIDGYMAQFWHDYWLD